MDRPLYTLPALPEDSYNHTLNKTALYGAMTGAIFETFFAVYYWYLGLPVQTVWLNLVSVIISLAAFTLLKTGRRQKLAANMVTLALYLSLIGSSLFTGGIDSSSMCWLLFVPVASALMSGKNSGLIWACICLTTAIGLYVLNRVLYIDFSTYWPDSSDRVADLTMAVLATTIASWLNETIKKGMMLRLEQAQKDLEELAERDPLTALYNRRYFFDNGQKSLAALSKVTDAQVSLLMIDIDQFKQLNDRHGHLVGDQIICGFADLCTQLIRRSDILARLGGEEFVVLLPDTQRDEAFALAENLRTKVEQAQFTARQESYRITISVGVVTRDARRIASLEQLVHLADTAMYQAKRSGRNRVFAES